MKFRALLVDDSENDAFLIRRKLSTIAEVSAVFSRDAFASKLTEPWDFILIDYILQGMQMTGEDAIVMARKEHPETPIIMVSGTIDPRKAVQAFNLGIYDYVFKDDIDKLPHVLEKAHEVSDIKSKMMRGQRVELLGELSAGLSHDLNNIFHTIGAAEELLREKITTMPEVKLLDVIKQVSRRGGEMVRQLTEFARGMNGGEFKSISAEFIVSEIREMLTAGTFPKNIRVETSTLPGTLNARCNETQIQQVLVNLCVNAKDAMPEGGTLRVTAQNRTIHGQTSTGEKLDGEFVCIEVSDTGSGIPEASLSRIWEAFFTTKGKGGTGLGLSIVRSIVADHGGGIDVATGASGTTFSIYIPVAVGTTDKLHADSKFGTGKTILLVDDEAGMRMLIPLQLQAAGYSVTVASNGPEALSHFRTNTKIDLLITDYSMPIMTGLELMDNLRSHNINLPVVMITGAGSDVPRTDVELLLKPFSQEALLTACEKALTATKAGVKTSS